MRVIASLVIKIEHVSNTNSKDTGDSSYGNSRILHFYKKKVRIILFFFFFPKKVVARVSDEVESHEASMSFAWTLALIKMEK